MKMTIYLITILILGLSINGQTATPKPMVTPANINTVIAKKGDTIASIAKRYGADAKEVAKFNGLLQNTVLPEGREVRIPSALNNLSLIELAGDDQILPTACRYVMDMGTAATNGTKLYFQWATRRKKYDTAEIWTCIVPINRGAYLKQFKLPKTYAYSLQFISVDCERSRYSADRLMPFDAERKPISARSMFWTSSFGEPIVPGSIGESIKQQLCRE